MKSLVIDNKKGVAEQTWFVIVMIILVLLGLVVLLLLSGRIGGNMNSLVDVIFGGV